MLGNIVDAANAMIGNNKYRVQKRLFTENPVGDLINYRLETDNEIEAWWVVDTMKAERDRFAWRDIAIFYRTNSQSRQLEDALRRENLPYQIYGTVRFYDRAEIKDLMGYVRALVNPQDDVSVMRILNTPARGLGQKAEATIEAEAGRRGISVMKVIESMVATNTPKLGAKLKVFVDLMTSLRQPILQGPVDEALETLLNAVGYVEYVKKKFPDQAVDKIENIHELGAALADFAGAFPDSTIAEWLQSVTLSSEESENKGGISLMTLHMAKGLEYPRVYIVGMEEGLLPHRISMDDAAGIEEERRLFYVGMTRAKEKLSLVGAYRRRTYNTWGANRPSRFLTEIPNQHFEPVAEAAAVSYRASSQDVRYESEASGVTYDYEDSQAAKILTVGQAVRHPTYGKGNVEQLVQEFGQTKAVVRFHEFGLRKVATHHLA